jgi:hypothetical protein
MLPHDTFLFFPVLPNLSVVRQPPAEMLVPAAKAQAATIGGSHRRWRDARLSSERTLGCGRRDTAGEKSPVRAKSYVRVDLQSLQPEQRGMTPA